MQPRDRPDRRLRADTLRLLCSRSHERDLAILREHRVLRLRSRTVGTSDLTTHVEWTSLAERAEESGLRFAGFTDQHHFLTGLLAAYPALASASAEQSRALQTLIHPEFIGNKFQFLGLSRNFAAAASLGGFKFAREARTSLGLA